MGPRVTMTRSPLVSVVMATYNHAAYVRQAIESVLFQADVDLELLIADDGSSDATREAVAEVRDSRVTFFPHTVNRGACVVTNELIDQARGAYIAVMNSDDIWQTGKLAHQLETLEGDLTLGAAFGRVEFIDGDEQPITKESLPFGHVFDQTNRTAGLWLRQFFDGGNCLCHPTILVRRRCYDEVGRYSNRLRQLPDFDMWIRLVKRYEIFVSERALVRFRILPGRSASSPNTVNSIRTMNEHLLIAQTFFEGVDRAHLVQGFGDLLVVPDVPTPLHLDVEKALLFTLPNETLAGPYQVTAMLQLRRLLDSPLHREVLAECYGIDDLWFQRYTGRAEALWRLEEPPVSPSRAVLNALRGKLRPGLQRGD
jgi:glycosyltransferase involved in cell wall biosynthesis